MRDADMYYNRGGDYGGRGYRNNGPRSHWDEYPEPRPIGFRGGGSDDWGDPSYRYGHSPRSGGGWEDDDWEPRNGRRRRDSRGRFTNSGGARYSDDEDYHTECGRVRPLDKATAKEWVEGMKGKGTKGEHWSMAQAKRMVDEYQIDVDPVEFYAVVNALHTDYMEVAQKYGVDRPEFWASLAEAWINDDDAKPEKAARYYQYIVDG